MLKHLSIATLALSALIFTACDGSNVTECSTDADCPAEQPVCDTSSDPGICVPEDDTEPECEEDLDCQLASPDSATSDDDCSATDDCDGGDNCVQDQLGFGWCVLIANDQAECTAADAGTLTSLTNTEGDTFSGCLADATCTEDGACE